MLDLSNKNIIGYKIKDEVDMGYVLEKLGFYYAVGQYFFSSQGIEIAVEKDTRFIFLVSDNSSSPNNFEILDKLFTLFDLGYVEKLYKKI